MPIPRPFPRLPVAALAGVLLLIISGCTDSQAGETESAGTAPSGVAASPTAAPSPSPTPETGDALLARIIPLPAGAKVWKTPPAEAMDLDAFVNAFYDPPYRTTARGRAEQRGFVAAAFRGWWESDGSADAIYLIEYRSEVGATSMDLGLTQTWKDDQQYEFVSDDSGHISGQLDRTLDKNGDARVWLITARRNVIIYAAHYSAATPDRPGALALLRRQADAIGPSQPAP